MGYVIGFLIGLLAGTMAAAIWYVLNRDRVEKKMRETELLSERLRHETASFSDQRVAFESHRNEFAKQIATYESKIVQYDSLVRENNGLKQDLFNLTVQAKKSERDHVAILLSQSEVDGRARDIADRYLDESVRWTGDRITANNYASCKKQLLDAARDCRNIGFAITAEREAELVQRLKDLYEAAVRKEFARQEQARIKAQIREEEKVRREVEKRIADAEREKSAVQAALDAALARASDQHSAEVELLKAKLREAEAKAERAKSQAQMTKAGHVYVISNIGSFGENIFKIGMTRRLEPTERVNELGDASVPFPFDVHMMISCPDAPSLENALHRELHKRRLNKVNFRKEFFRVDLETIRKITEERHGKVEYIADPEALQYRESISMKDEDFEFVAEVNDIFDEEEAVSVDDP